MADTSNRGLASADEETRERVARAGGEARRDQGADYSELGHKGGQASPGKFQRGSRRAREAGRRGGMS